MRSAVAVKEIGQLAALAECPEAAKRGDIYCAVSSLYRTQGNLLSGSERALMREILHKLASRVEMAIRLAAAEAAADDPDAPLDLVLFLASEDVALARPLLLRSARLSDREILTFIAQCDIARQAICAARADIGESVTEALSRSDAEPVLLALVRNATARIAAPAFARIAEKSKALPSLQQPLAHRSDLPPDLALRMCDWVSAELKACIGRLHPEAFHAANEAVERGANSIKTGGPDDSSDSSLKLIEKLAVAGQLKAGFLLRVLQQGQLELFELGLSRLLELDRNRTLRVLYESGPRPVAMVCRAIGIDRCVFPTVYNLSRGARRIHPLLQPSERTDADAVFNTYTKPEALAWLRAC